MERSGCGWCVCRGGGLVGRSNSVAYDMMMRTGRESGDTLPSGKLRQHQTVRNLGARLLRPDKKRQTLKLPVECYMQRII